MDDDDREIGCNLFRHLREFADRLFRHGRKLHQIGVIVFAACFQARTTLSKFVPIFMITRASVSVICSTSFSSEWVPIITVSTSSPHVIGAPVAVQAPDMPVMAGTTSTGTTSLTRVYICMKEP